MEDNLILMKLLLQIDNYDRDDICNFYLTKSKNAVKKYCLLTEEEYLLANLSNQTVELAMFYYLNMKNVGLKSASEGPKSKSFEGEAIPTLIKKTLPSPAIFSA